MNYMRGCQRVVCGRYGCSGNLCFYTCCMECEEEAQDSDDSNSDSDSDSGSDSDSDSDDEEPRTFGAYDILVVSPNDPHVNLHDFLSNNLSKVKEYCDTYGLDYKNIRAYEVDEDPNSDGEYEVNSYDNGIKYKKIKENDILLTEGAAE